jgi:hypothetical protein
MVSYRVRRPDNEDRDAQDEDNYRDYSEDSHIPSLHEQVVWLGQIYAYS